MEPIPNFLPDASSYQIQKQQSEIVEEECGETLFKELTSYMTKDVLIAIFSQLNAGTLEVCNLVNHQWRKLIINFPSEIMREKIADFKKFAWGPHHWEKLIRDHVVLSYKKWGIDLAVRDLYPFLPKRMVVLSDEEIKAAYSILPSNIHEILNSPCPLLPKAGKLIKDTHVFAYAPEAILGFKIDFKFFGELVAKYFLPCKKNKWQGFDDDRDTRFQVPGYSRTRKTIHKINPSVAERCWVLMAKDMYEACEWKKIAKQHKILKELSEHTELPYAVPRLMEAVIAINAQFIMFSEYLFIRKNEDDCIQLFDCEEEVEATDNLDNPLMAQIMVAGHKKGLCVLDGGGWGHDRGVPLMRFLPC